MCQFRRTLFKAELKKEKEWSSAAVAMSEFSITI